MSENVKRYRKPSGDEFVLASDYAWRAATGEGRA